MTLLAVAVFWVLVGLLAAQALLAFAFMAALLRFRRKLPDDDACPPAAVVLCLRGTDPFLPDTVEALIDLDYPRLDVLVIVDDRQDPAWAVVADVVKRRAATHVRIEPLVQRLDTCSLKCSSVVQAISQLDDACEIVALLDADTIPHPTWLRELAAPLADERVAAATGNRWYMPQRASWGSMIRYIWNSAAIVQMYVYSIAWGGTLAIKTKVLRESDLLSRWSNSFCEDTMLFRELRRQNLKVAFVPSLMMINREDCDIGGFFRWVRRQLLTARLYHPGWPGVVAHGLLTSLFTALALVLIVAGVAAGDYSAAFWAGIGLAIYEAAIAPLVVLVEWAVRRIAVSRGQPTRWFGPGALLRFLPAIPLTQIVYAAALTSAMFFRNVDWRGVRYRVDGPFHIRLLEYKPFESDSQDNEMASL